VPHTKNNLGPLIAEYRDRPLKWRDLAITFIPAVVAVLIPLIYGWARGNYAKNQFGPAVVQQWQWPWFALATVALIPLLGLGLRRIRQAHRIIKVFQLGLIIQGTQGRKWIYRWEEIEGVAVTTWKDVFLGIQVRQRHRVVLFPVIGKPLQLDSHIHSLDELAARIKAKIYPHILPQLRTALAKNLDLNFGKIFFNKQRINLGNATYPWDDINRVNLQQGYLMVEFKNQKVEKIPAGKVPNIELLIQLIEEGVEA